MTDRSAPGINRRQLLRGLGGGALLTAGAAGAAHGTAGDMANASAAHDAGAQPPKPGPCDVIVIGGGFAGVTAARDLSMAGLQTLLLEARSRLGGRTFTSKFAHHDVDLGGTWIGLEQPFVWSERLRYGLDIVESAQFTAAERAIYLAGGKQHATTPEQFGKYFASGVSKYLAPAAQVFPRPFDPFHSDAYLRYDKLSAAEALEQLRLPQPEHDIVSGLASINGHTFARDIGYLDQLKWYALGAFDPMRLFENCARYRLAGGTRSLLDAMARDIRGEVRTGAPVAAVVKEGDRYSVTTATGESFVARAVIVAVPLNTLVNIRFEPGISPAKIAASRERITGSGIKFYAHLKNRHPVFSAQGPDQVPLTFLWTEYIDADSQIAVGFGPSPELLDIHDQEAVQRAVNVYLPDAEVIESVGYDWNLDPYSSSTWCMYRPMFFTRYLRELQQPEGNLYFAGSDIASGWRGFIDGAIETGARSAVLVRRRLAA